MAKETTEKLNHQVIYQIYTRNFTLEGTFSALELHLDRLVELGVDILYLLPIHPIGSKDRKGKLGSPYSISDFYGVNPELGTLEELRSFLMQAHKKGLKVMIDIVFNHTSKDHPWLEEHPEYYYKDIDGNFSNRVGDWSDITDLDYNYKPLWNVMHDILVYWAKFGFDGYRCDVASLVPVEFWKEAREKVAKVNPNFIWLAESVHKEFVKEMREYGFECASDCELYQAFDITYDYDIYQEFEEYFDDRAPLSKFVDRLQLQEMIYPKNYIKSRAYENHDQVRLMKRTQDTAKTKNWMAAVFMLKGSAFLNGGIETLSDHLPDLFNKDTIDWTTYDPTWLEELKRLVALKKEPIFGEYDHYQVSEHHNAVLHVVYTKEDQRYVGILNVGQVKEMIEIALEDATYINEFNQKEVIVKNGLIKTDSDPIIIKGKSIDA